MLELPNEPTGGPRQIANTFATNEDVRQALLPYTTGDADRVSGNLLTLPVGDTFMYVQPVYTRRAGESNFPILRFVLVSYEGNVGIGETLRGAIADSLILADDGGRGQNQSPQPTDEPSPTESPAPSRRSRRARSRPSSPGDRPRRGAAAAGQGQVRPGRRGPAPGGHGAVGPADGAGSPARRPGRAARSADPDLGPAAHPCNVLFTDAGWSSSVARWAHNPEVAGSNPAPATKFQARRSLISEPESI